eukprot:CAMPEP_0119307650 /NCGR_PEP_ID=MMETSP1333-20130426/8086_1 /TAXON_ID=418940 /ORGANISM="Scyphosphaera apsteinii, Strain RCC1455" /LENGTH=342 /DNA_ID=CAMNT_0007311241 /DNA_START=252 /DNA_END=1280 /DNA_ORIENTATION=-
MAPPVLTKKQAPSPAPRLATTGQRPRPPAPPLGGGGQAGAGICACSSGSAMTATTWYKDIKTPYDPAHPNDYDEWVKEVEAGRKAKKLEEALQRKQDEASKAFSSLSSAHREGESNGTSGKRPRSPPTTSQPPPPPPPPMPAGFSAADATGDPGLAMLQKMGWSEGQGLGKEGQGMKTPLMAKKSDGQTGVIVNASERRPPPPPPPPPAPPTGMAGAVAAAGSTSSEKKGAVTFRGRPSRVLLLKNMVAPSEVDAELRGEIGEECSKYGEVAEVLVYELADEGAPEEERVRIFVKFAKQAAAMKAYIDLDGRYFGGRNVWVCFFKEADFDAGNLAPNAGEPK